MAEETQQTEGPPAKKEAAVLQESSLQELAKEVAPKWMHMALYLSIPNTTIVNMQLDGEGLGSSQEDRSQAMLFYWKKMRSLAKDKEKISDLERALREMEKADVADILMDRHRDNLQLTPECFS